MRYITSDKFLNLDLDGKMIGENGGGGMSSKLWNITRAFPNIEASNELGTDINLIDPIWINMNNDRQTLETHLTQITESSALNILWQEELSMFRVPLSDKRIAIMDAVDHIFNCNQYLNKMMQGYILTPMDILYTPIDAQFYKPMAKRPQIVAMGYVGVQKNIEGIIKMFKALPDTIDKIYIGSAGLWGDELSTPAGKALEKQLDAVCERHTALDKQEVADVLAESWGYLNMARYDTGCLSFLEAAMSGCHCFCWNPHPMFDEYPYIYRFNDVEDGAPLIMRKLTADTQANQSVRNFIQAKHSYESVRESLRTLIGGLLI